MRRRPSPYLWQAKRERLRTALAGKGTFSEAVPDQEFIAMRVQDGAVRFTFCLVPGNRVVAWELVERVNITCMTVKGAIAARDTYFASSLCLRGEPDKRGAEFAAVVADAATAHAGHARCLELAAAAKAAGRRAAREADASAFREILTAAMRAVLPDSASHEQVVAAVERLNGEPTLEPTLEMVRRGRGVGGVICAGSQRTTIAGERDHEVLHRVPAAAQEEEEVEEAVVGVVVVPARRLVRVEGGAGGERRRRDAGRSRGGGQL